MPKNPSKLQILEDIRDNILKEERVCQALPDWYEVPAIVLDHSTEGPLGQTWLDITGIVCVKISIKTITFVDSGQLEATMRHEIAHSVEIQRGEVFDHGLGYKAILHELYGNDHDFYYHGNVAIEKERKVGDR